jgi:DNA-binding IclR family transcriptional regulator
MPTNNYISLIEKTMRVIGFLGNGRKMPLGEIASNAKLVKSSTYRILYTLQKLGYVEKNERGYYSLSARLSFIVGRLDQGQDLVRLAEPLMVSLVSRFRETVNLGVLDGDEVLYIHVLQSPQPLRLAAQAGMRDPIHSTALGKCLVSRFPQAELDAVFKRRPMTARTPRSIRNRSVFLRELKRVNQQGYAVDDGEDSVGVRCVGAPILNSADEVVAALSISGPGSRVRPDREEEIATEVIKACRQISRLLSYRNKTIPAVERRP